MVVTPEGKLAVYSTANQDNPIMDISKERGIPILGIVENMSIYVCPNCNHQEHIFGQGGGQKMCDQYGVDFLGSLPLNLSIREQADSGKPTVAADPDGAISAIYKTIARKIAIQVADMSKDMTSKFPSIVVTNT